MKRSLLPLVLPLALVAAPVLAQDSDEARDRGFIAGLIEDNLASPGLSVRIDGFSGALSSKASIDVLQVSDDQGAWLRLEDVVLDWNRSALLRGRLEVEELSAALIRVERAPLPAEGVEALPDAGASGFSLPDLPVSVEIGSLHADRIELGAPLLGQDLALSLDASATLAGGSGEATIEAQRLDGVTGTFSIAAAYGKDEQRLTVDLDITEAEGGIAATMLSLPGAPAIELTVKGDGPLDAFAADIGIASDGEQRIGGKVTLEGTDDGRIFDVDLGGDVTALFAPRYQAFFGDDIALKARGLQGTDGTLDLQTLDLRTQALQLAGRAQIGADGWPTLLDITGTLAAEDGTPILLPTADNDRLRRADLEVTYDAGRSEDWTLALTARGYETPTLTLGDAKLNLSGAIDRQDGVVATATAAIDAALNELEFLDPALAQAAGSRLALTGDVDWAAGQPVRLSQLDISGADFNLTGSVIADSTDPEKPLTVTFDLATAFDDLRRLSGLSGQELSGTARASVSGDYAPVAGTFDLALEAVTQDLALAIPQADALLAGQTTLSVKTRRTVDGTFLDALSLDNAQMTASGRAALLGEDSAPRQQGEVSNAAFTARIVDGTRIDPRLDGPIELTADVTQDDAGLWQGKVDATAPEDVTLSAEGTLTGETPDVDFTASIPRLDPFAPGVPGGVNLKGRAFAQDGIWSIDADAAGPYDVTAKVAGRVTGPAPEIDFSADLPDLFAAVPALEAVPGLDGAVALKGTVNQFAGQWAVDTSVNAPSGITLRARGPVTGDAARIDIVGTVPDLGDFTTVVSGRLDLEGAVARTAGDWSANLALDGPYGARVTAETILTRSPLQVAFTADLDDLSQFAPVPGGLSVSGEAVQTDTGFRIDVDGTGPYAATLDATVTLEDGVPAVTATGRIPDAGRIAPQLQGPLTYDVSAVQEDGQFRVDAKVDGAQALSARVTGLATGPDADLDFRLTVGNVAAFAPGLNGALDASGRLFQKAGQWNVDVDANGPLRSTLTAQGTLTGDAPNARFTLAVPDIGPLVPDISGPLRVEGTARQQGEAYAIDIDVDGPSGTNAAVSGTVRTDATLDLTVKGSAPLGLANAALAPQSIAGVARFDLALRGPAGLDAVSGTVSTSGAALVIPSIGNGLDNIDARIALSNGRAQIALTATPQSGGSVSVNGPVTLSAPFDADLTAEFNADLEDPKLYTARVIGRVNVNGPLTGGALISGDINIDGAEIAVPSSGLTAIGDLPPITHLNTPRPVRRTLDLAGQTENTGAAAERAAAGPAYGLALNINAPGRIFIRGRGLDAELGGSLQLRGTTANPVTAGGFELVRGRLDILQKRFELDEGTITFQGGLLPYIRLVARTESDTLSAAIVVEGPADAIEVTFESTPQVPQEEVVAQIFFGRDLSQLSPLQALQLANSVATLAGRGNGGLLDKLRGSAGLDDLDITTDDEGNVALKAGKYISDNVYTDVQVDQNGDAAISLNLDVTPSLTVRGSTGAEGNTALGLFFEKDY